jgi:hypothetical protein
MSERRRSEDESKEPEDVLVTMLDALFHKYVLD